MRHYIIGLALLAASSALADSTPVSPAAETHFVNLHDGDTVKSPFKVVFGSSNVTIAPAGAVAPNSGHYHLLIDTRITPAQLVGPLPNDPQHLHFGKGQTEAMVTLPPGTHTLQIVLGDGHHWLHARPVESQPITVHVH
jgi:hypothetical protein